MTTEEKLRQVSRQLLHNLGTHIYPYLNPEQKEELRQICFHLQETFIAYDTLVEELNQKAGIFKLPSLSSENGPEWGNN